jgi:hypothetical protein
MAGNISPIFARIGKINWGQLAAQNQLTGDLSSSAALIFTADATNGSIVTEVRWKIIPGTATVATAARLWINNGGALGTNTNNTLLTEITLAAFTSSHTAANPDYVMPMPRGGLILPAGYKLYATIGTYSTGTFMITAIGGDY